MLFLVIVWNLFIWWFGLLFSFSYVLVGGLVGVVVVGVGNNFGVVIWVVGSWWLGSGVIFKVIVLMVVLLLMGFVFGFVLMGVLYVLFLWLFNCIGFFKCFGCMLFVNVLFGKV